VVQTNTNFDMCREVMAILLKHLEANFLVLIECVIHCTVHGTNNM